MPVLPVTDATFEAEVLSSNLPVLIDLYADWCGPCKQVAPIVEQISTELAGKLKVVKVDVDRSPEIAASFRVQSIPMLVIMAGGEVHRVLMGAQPKAQILAALEDVMPRERGEVTPGELQRLLEGGRVVAIDTRDAASYGRAHVPGALHVPAAELAARAGLLLGRLGKPAVVYGRTGDDSMAAADSLREARIEVAFLKGGLLEWEGDGLPIERSS
ncbi:MAG: thioredoxin [Deltaproteobacteria bacterium]|nr:thioredoxin [Deltaproteobacteria bacterium]